MGASVVDTTQQSLPLPAMCKSCGGASKPLYLDTGTSENDYGAILYCIECVTDFANLFGFIATDKATEIKRLAEEQWLQNVTLNDRVEKLTGVIDALVSSGYRNDTINFIELDLVHLDSLVNSEPSSREEPMDNRKVESAEQVNVERMDNLHADRDDFKLFG